MDNSFISLYVFVILIIIAEFVLLLSIQYQEKQIILDRLKVYITLLLPYLFILYYFIIKGVYEVSFTFNLGIWLLFCIIFINVFQKYRYGKSMIYFNYNNRGFKIGLALLLILFTLIFIIAGIQNISGTLNAPWFQQTFSRIGVNRNTQATIGLMGVGALTIIMANVRQSENLAIGGYFLVITMPIISIFSTLTLDRDNIRTIASPIYSVIKDEGFTLIIYVALMTYFYLIVVSAIILISSNIKTRKMINY